MTTEDKLFKWVMRRYDERRTSRRNKDFFLGTNDNITHNKNQIESTTGGKVEKHPESGEWWLRQQSEESRLEDFYAECMYSYDLYAFMSNRGCRETSPFKFPLGCDGRVEQLRYRIEGDTGKKMVRDLTGWWLIEPDDPSFSE
ncbi:hypothetical protein QKT49_gp231 [Acanthamoeba castellanii medusavirus]|uniref:Uncharacterized protein n=1 Tax=Acanthamoeba castellanii medusavirus J1 TaxID=3114988 RepID=A0A3T1CXH0_9VIRU|nr:hypothetical protein QKT49_gp231 [Acanthamoeba castellanii medusavirus]BBI30532.1 hypothetical protein [Acanthamoeba castellanii medusavirus J1]